MLMAIIFLVACVFIAGAIVVNKSTTRELEELAIRIVRARDILPKKTR